MGQRHVVLSKRRSLTRYAVAGVGLILVLTVAAVMLFEVWGWLSPFGGQSWPWIPQRYYASVFLKGKGDVALVGPLDGAPEGRHYVVAHLSGKRQALLIMGPKDVFVHKVIAFDASGKRAASFIFQRETSVALSTALIAKNDIVYDLASDSIACWAGAINDEGTMAWDKSTKLWECSFKPDGSVKAYVVYGDTSAAAPTEGKLGGRIEARMPEGIQYDANGDLVDTDRGRGEEKSIATHIETEPYLKQIGSLQKMPELQKLTWPWLAHRR